MLNARILKRWRAGKFPIGLIGERVDLTYPYDYLGAGIESLGKLAGGEGDFAKVFKAAERPLDHYRRQCIRAPGWRGDGSRPAAKAAMELGAVKDGWNGFSVLHTAASRVGALDIGFVPGEGGVRVAADGRRSARSMCCFLLGADEIDIAAGAFVVYIGTHGDRGAHRADVILPGAAYPEKSGIYVNTEGRVQMANARFVSAWRCARGLGDHSRAVGSP